LKKRGQASQFCIITDHTVQSRIKAKTHCQISMIISKISSIGVLLLAVVVTSIIGHAAELPLNFEETVERYLSVDRNYERGALITKSHLDDLQSYLRRSYGHSIATHVKWQRRMLPDNSRLSQLFYAGGGRFILSKAASQLGGYAKLERLSISSEGRKILHEAIKNNATDVIIQHFEADKLVATAKIEAAPANGSTNESVAPKRSTRIYTAADYVAQVSHSSPSNKKGEKPAKVEAAEAN